MMNLENTLERCLDAALEAHAGGYAQGMMGVIKGIEDALEALDDVLWGDAAESVFPEITYEVQE